MLSVVIPSWQDKKGLYLTYTSAFAQLEASGIGHEFIVVADGGIDIPFEQNPDTKVLRGSFGSPQHSRDAGIRAARFPYVVCLDSHVSCGPGLFNSLLFTAKSTEAAAVFPAMAFYQRRALSYSRKIDWMYGLHVAQALPRPQSEQPHRIADACHGVFLLNREKYVAAGGYSLEQKGWGGEEEYLNLKFWMLGEECWMVPNVYHWHYTAESRRSDADRMRSAEYARNYMLASYVLGGERYLYKSAGCFVSPQKENYAAARAAFVGIPRDATIKADRAKVEAGPFGGDLDRLRAHFKSQDIPV